MTTAISAFATQLSPERRTSSDAFLATMAPTRRQRFFAYGLIAVSIVIALIAAPFAKVKLAQIDAFIPAYQSALIITDLVTAVLLLGQFIKVRSRALLVLAAGYLFGMMIVVFHTLSFPNVFAPGGVIGGGTQTTAFLYNFWHGGFSLFVIAYALLKDRGPLIPRRMIVPDAVFSAVAVAVLVGVLVLLATAGHDYLPVIIVNNLYTPTMKFVVSATWILAVLAVALIWWRGVRSVLDLWLIAVMVAWVFDISFSAVLNGARYDLGFYLGRAYGLLAASLVLAVVLLETSGVFGRLAEENAELSAETDKLKDDVRENIARAERTEAQLRQAQKMEAIGNLTGGMAHDFNNLLAVVIGNLDILVARKQGDADVQELGTEALDAALRGADLTQRLLAFARQQPLQPRRVDANLLITNITRLLARTLGSNVEITTDLASDLFPITVDPAQLDSALANLANNARDAMPNGGSLNIVTGNRHLDADYAAAHAEVTPGDYVMIEVSDTGTGMPADVLEKVFEPFFTTKPQGKGSGLGLSMAYGFMKQSGGHINVYSEQGIGTTFRLYLPRSHERAESAIQPAAPSDALAGHGEIVLAVEDNASLRRVVVRHLEELGYRVLEAANAPAAVRILEREPVDLLFTDVIMTGGISGVELARHAKSRWPKLRILLTSGFPDMKVNGNGHAPGRLLNKPYRKEDLAHAIRDVLTH